MPVKLTVYGGANEIGGNKILLEDGDTRIFLDFGAGFSDGLGFYTDDIKPRAINGAGDYFEFGLLPEIEGLYTSEALFNTNLEYCQPKIDSVLLSHFHQDHSGRIKFVDPEIPIYCGETTKLIHEAYSSATPSVGSPLDGHDIKPFRTGDKLRIGSLDVVPVHVDHSIPGAYGFVIYTSEGAIAYTGDFRFHGPMFNMTHDFVEKAREADAKCLITEGTRVSDSNQEEPQLTEPQLTEKAVSIITRSSGKLVLSSFRGNDIDRIKSFYRACEKTGRQLVVSTKAAALIRALKDDVHLEVPEIGKGVKVYIRRKKSGTFDDKDYFKWERPFVDQGITFEEIQKSQGEIFLHLDVWNFPELIDIRPESGGSYIHASTEAFNEEGEEEERIIRNWAEHFGFSYNQLHASGHASMKDVDFLIKEVRAKSVVPVHSERPDLFSIFCKSTAKIPVKGKSFSLS